MTAEEAIERLRKRICCEDPIQHFCRDNCMHGVDACEVSMAIEALEKRIPQKVDCNHCPACEENVVGSGFYCWNCGQALKWGYKDEE